jgi:uncharacterized protein YjbI with pentapeptide repeats
MFARLLRVTGTVLVIAVALVTPVLVTSTPTSADTVVNGCTIVANPTATNFTNCPGADLSGANLSGVDLSFANFAGANFVGCQFSTFSCDPADLNGANLTDANLSGGRFYSALGGPFGPVKTGSAEMAGATLSGADLSGAVMALVDLTGATMTAVNATRADLGFANLTEADLANANLPEATFTYCAFLVCNCQFSSLNCDGANLTGATLIDANLTDATLDDTTLTDSNLTGATLTGANLSETLLVPPDQTVPATSVAGAVVTWPPGEPLPGATPGTCTPPSSGSTLPIGTTTLTCQVLDDQGNLAAGTFTVTVNPLPTTTSLTSSTNPSLVGQQVTYTASVSPTPNGGTVDFSDEGTNIAGCEAVPLSGASASCSTTPSIIGAQTVVAVYGGSADFAFSIAQFLTQEVVTGIGTTTSISSSISPSVLGQPVTYTATVSPTPTGGTVAFSDNGSRIAGCTAEPVSGPGASCSVTPGTTGAHNIVATYSGSGGFFESTSPSFTQVVTKTPCNTLAGCNLSGLNLSGASLGGPDLQAANLNRAKLTGANLSGANLTDANLNSTDLMGANLAAATVTADTNFNNVTWGNTTCPDGTNSDNDRRTCVGHL